MMTVRFVFCIALLNLCAPAARADNRIVVTADSLGATISRHIYGQFAEHLGRCIYGGIWVGGDSDIPNIRGIRTDVVAALREIAVPNIRWPGGCFADEYHWMDGIGPRADRPSMVNTNWGGVTEDNSFGTHEFLDLCEQLGCEPYICGNIGSGTVRELAQWVEYVNSDAESPMTKLRMQNGREKPWNVRLWGIGNESWGCGGRMRPEYYMDVYRRYATYCRTYPDRPLFKVAGGPTANFADDFYANYHWTEVMMQDETTRQAMNGLSLHYYTFPPRTGDISRSATEFGEKDWFAMIAEARRMDDILTRHSAIMDYYDPAKKIALVVDEWGTWYQVEPGTNPGFLYQQNTLRDALVASATLDIFHRHCDRVRMANIAQTVNVLQSMILTNGPQMVLTPTYYVFKMYKVHQDARMLPVTVTAEPYSFGGNTMPGLSASASCDKDGVVHLSITNLNPDAPATVTCDLRGITAIGGVSGTIITAKTMQVFNNFGDPEEVSLKPFDGFKRIGGGIIVTMPAMSVVTLAVTVK